MITAPGNERAREAAVASCASRRPFFIYLLSAFAALVIYVAHAYSLPLLVTYDGHWYLKLAEVLGTPRFPAEWDFLRTPLFPALLRLAFELCGRGAGSVILLQTALGYAGIVLLTLALYTNGRRAEAAVLFLLLALYPTLSAFQHIVLSEVGTFFFLALILFFLLVPIRAIKLQTFAVILALSCGYYHRSSLLYMSIVVAPLYFWLLLKRRTVCTATLHLRRSTAIHSAIVLVLPFVIAYPWQRNRQVAIRTGESVLIYGIVKQAVLPPQDALWKSPEARQVYSEAIRSSTTRSVFPFEGIKNEAEYAPIEYINTSQQSAGSVFLYAIAAYPARYLRGVFNNIIILSGAGGSESDSLYLAAHVFAPSGWQIANGPAGWPPLPREFHLNRKTDIVSRGLAFLLPVYQLLVVFAFWAAVINVGLGIYQRNVALLSLGLLPLAFILLHAAVLTSQDRLAVPAYPVLLTNLVGLPRSLTERVSQRKSG